MIPKDSMLIPNLHSVLYDPEVFEDTETFRPSRFLDAKGKLINVDKVLAFSLGSYLSIRIRINTFVG